MYAKIAGTGFTEVDKFVATAIKEMQKTHGLPKQKVVVGKTGDGRAFFINEYPARKTYSQWERVAYIQLPNAVAFIVLSSRDEADYKKDAPRAARDPEIFRLHGTERRKEGRVAQLREL